MLIIDPLCNCGHPAEFVYYKGSEHQPIFGDSNKYEKAYYCGFCWSKFPRPVGSVGGSMKYIGTGKCGSRFYGV